MDYKILTDAGNIAFYDSCEITEIFLYRKKDKAIFNFFTIAVLEEKLFDKTNETYLTDKPIKINDEYLVGVKRYWLSKQEAENNFILLKTQNQWSLHGATTSQFPPLKFLPKQFIPANEGNRLNRILKNNFHNGSYILEFFDEQKTNLAFLLNIEALNKLNKVSEKIKQIVPIDLSVVRDRIGNFIFQFPITILEIHAKALQSWDGVDVNFSWHQLLSTPPDCLLQVESTFAKNYMGSVIEEYNKTQNQLVNIGNLDQINHIKFWRRKPSLILSTQDGSYVREFVLNMSLINPEPRIFELDGSLVKVEIASKDKTNKKISKPNYTTYINNHLYDEEKKQLEKSLSFKQYRNVSDGIADLQKLIQQKDENGVYLWDPFLNSTDILKTLYYSKTDGVPLKAIGSTNDMVRSVYDKKGMTVANIISEYRNILENPNNNNHHLNLEFRIQHTNFGWSFHDRFLIFPSSELRRSQVYSLGTSINSFGMSHHILQEVSHPQPVVDAFNELWSELNHPECLVWKFPK